MNDKVDFERIGRLRFLLIVGIVLLHAYGSALTIQGVTVGIESSGVGLQFLRDFISQGLARSCVPVYFLISGYLYFHDNSGSGAEYLKKTQGRIRSLLIPYLCWNAGLAALIFAAQAWPPTSGLFSGKKLPLAELTVPNLIDSILGVTRMPIAYQFWFVRDLFILSLLSFAVDRFNRYLGWGGILLIAIAWVCNAGIGWIPSVEGTLFFAVGALLARSGRPLFFSDHYYRPALLLFMVMVTADILTGQWKSQGLIHKVGIISGVVALLGVSAAIGKYSRLREWLTYLSGFSFIVFAVHEPLLTMLRKITFVALNPGTDLLIGFLYLALPALVIALSIFAGSLAMNHFPKAYSVATGGR